MLKSCGIDHKLARLTAIVLIGASYCSVLAEETGCAGDVDADGDVDLFDYAEFSVCFSGSDGGTGADCACFDLHGDFDVDLSDFNLFWHEFTGPPGECAGGLTWCSGNCVAFTLDPSNCGGCGIQCPENEPNCIGGKCQTGDCPPGETDCDGTCTNTASDNANCGACGNVCGAGFACGCGGVCVDLMWDALNCGFCGNMCNPQDYCAWGSCSGYCIGCEP